MYVEHVNSALTNNQLYEELTNWKKMVIFNHQNPKRPRVLERLPDFVLTELSFETSGPPIRSVVELDKQGQALESEINLETSVYFFL